MTSHTFRPASSINEPTPLLVGIAGGTGSGKTFSALRLARGIVGPEGRIVVLDTEKRRSLHYRKDFVFDFAEIAPPFTPEAYWSPIEAAEQAKYDAIIIDSTSHVWAGDGGCLDMHEEVVKRIAKGDWKKAERVSALAWAEPKQRYKRMMSRILQCRAHIIFCLRAEQKLKAVKVTEHGKEITKFIDAGWQPVCEKHLMFEMTCSFLMVSEQPGVPQPIKLPETMRRFFPEGQRMGEDAGKLLAQWSQDPHYGLNTSQFGKTDAKVEAPKPGEPGRLVLMGADGAQIGTYATGGTWLTAFENALTEAMGPEVVGKVWDNNSDLFYKVQAGAANNPKASARCNDVGRLAHQLMAAGTDDVQTSGDGAPAQGGLL